MILRKKKKCLVCGKETYLFSKGRCKPCTIKASDQAVNKHLSGTNTAEMERWFLERRKEMTGKCWHCGKPSCKNNDQYYKFSIAHILPKKLFKSVATHPLNWIELCFWAPSCHTNFDNYILDITELNCYNEIIERFVEMYPDIAHKERKNIPSPLIEYIKDQQDIPSQ